MIFRRCWILLVGNELVEGGLLPRRARQDQGQHHVGGCGARAILRNRPLRMMIAEHLKLRGIDSPVETAGSLCGGDSARKCGEQQDNGCL